MVRSFPLKSIFSGGFNYFCTILTHGGRKSTLLCDSGKDDPQQLLIFSTKVNLKLLAICDHWYADILLFPPLFS